MPALLARLARRARRHRPLGAAEAGDRRLAGRRLGAARQAGAGRVGGVEPAEVEEVWHGLAAALPDAVRLARGTAPRPERRRCPVFRPLMLAQPLEDADLDEARPDATTCAEWKWDGIRVQVAAGERREAALLARRRRRLGRLPRHRRGGDFEGVLDGELLVVRDGEVAPFNDLQQRLNRKAVTPKMLREYPASVRLYDMLRRGRGGSARPCPSPSGARGWRRSLRASGRAAHRPVAAGAVRGPGTSSSELREGAREHGIEGLMLKRADSALRRRPAEGPVVQVEARRAHRSTRC